MIALLFLVLAILASPFKSKTRLEAENAVLRHQLIVLERKFRPPALEETDDGIAALPHIRLDRALQFLIGDRLR